MRLFNSLLFIALFFTSVAAQQEFCLNLEIVDETADKVTIGVFVQGTDTPFGLGTSNFQFSFDGNTLQNPTLETSYLTETITIPGVGTFTIYQPPSVTEPRPNEASLNIELTQTGGGQTIDASPNFFRLADIEFDRVRNTADLPVAWTYDGGTTGTVVFLNDNATQIFASDPACLTGIEAAALPTTLTYFTALPMGKRSWLNWETETEENNKGFHVEHSVDGVSFSDIGFVDGMGYGANYEFYHDNPATGVNYYRFRQEDYDGRMEKSPIRQVLFTGVNDELVVYPNPARDVVNVSGLDLSQETRLELYELSGRTVAAVDNAASLRVDRLPAGTYTLRVKEGEELSYLRVVVTK